MIKCSNCLITLEFSSFTHMFTSNLSSREKKHILFKTTNQQLHYVWNGPVQPLLRCQGEDCPYQEWLPCWLTMGRCGSRRIRVGNLKLGEKSLSPTKVAWNNHQPPWQRTTDSPTVGFRIFNEKKRCFKKAGILTWRIMVFIGPMKLFQDSLVIF